MSHSISNTPISSAVNKNNELVSKNSSTTNSSFYTMLSGFLKTDSDGRINEEQLYSALLNQRMFSKKGEYAATAYQKLFETNKNALKRSDGYIPVEKAASSSIKQMVQSGVLTENEAISINAQAFKAAQLDGDTNYIYDSRGSTVAVALIESALNSAEERINSYDSGKATAGTLNLDNMINSPVIATTGQNTLVNQSIDKTSADTVDEYSKSETYSYYNIANGGRMAWRIPRKGPSFDSNLKVVFSDGHTVQVKDTSKNYRESDGFVFKPGIGANGEGDNNTGTAHGGIYIHAPYGNHSTKLTIYYS